MKIMHKNLTEGKWGELSLFEQLGNVGSEINRIIRFKNRDEQLYSNAAERAIELLNLTINDPRWRNRLKELIRTREALLVALYGGGDFSASLEELDRYFYQFALASRLQK